MKPEGLAVTIATRVPAQGNEVLKSYGYKPATNHKELAGKLITFQSTHREDALRSLYNIHPDKDLIVHFHEEEKAKALAAGKSAEKISNCCADGNKKSSAEGTTIESIIAGHTISEWLPLGIAAVLFVGSIIVFTSEKSKS